MIKKVQNTLRFLFLNALLLQPVQITSKGLPSQASVLEQTVKNHFPHSKQNIAPDTETKPKELLFAFKSSILSAKKEMSLTQIKQQIAAHTSRRLRNNWFFTDPSVLNATIAAIDFFHKELQSNPEYAQQMQEILDSHAHYLYNILYLDPMRHLRLIDNWMLATTGKRFEISPLDTQKALSSIKSAIHTNTASNHTSSCRR